MMINNLAIAKLYLRKHPEENEEEFMKGTLLIKLYEKYSVHKINGECR